MRKSIPFLFGVAGLAVLTVIVGWLGAGRVTHAVLSVSVAGFACVVAIQLGLYLVMAWAWHVAWPGVTWARLLLGRMVRESGTTCLPFSHLGGIAFGMKAIVGPETGLPQAFAATVVDVTVETMAQIIFIACGLVALEATSGDRRFTWPLLAGLALMAGGVGAFAWLQSDGGRLVRRVFAGLSRNLARQWRAVARHGMEEIQVGLENVYDHKPRLALASVLQLTAWIGGAGWTWFVYQRLGAPLGPVQALAVEGW